MFDLERDPGETTDVSARFSDRSAEDAARLRTWSAAQKSFALLADMPARATNPAKPP